MEHIDIEAVVRQKYKGYLPKFVFRWLKKLIHQDELNKMNDLFHEHNGVATANGLITYLEQQVEVVGYHRLPPLEERALFVSNHPLGGADGIIYTALLGKKYGGDIALLVNDLLLNLDQFTDVFVPVNKYGAQGRERQSLIESALRSEKQVLTFPAGLCSRLNSAGQVYDLQWHTSFIRMAQRSQRIVVPMFFQGVNSSRFYKWARRREKWGIKFNYELVLLPDEFVRSRGKSYRIYIGEPIPADELPTGRALQPYATALRNSLYTYPQRYAKEKIETIEIEEKGALS